MMDTIPIRKLKTPLKEPEFSGQFDIRDIGRLLAGKDLLQELHRHDFYFMLVLEEGTGTHEIDFTPYEVHDHTVFAMRPGQVHRLELKRGGKGFLLQFSTDFILQAGETGQLWRKASYNNHCTIDAVSFEKLHTPLTYVFQEYASRKEHYPEAIRANLAIFFIELLRQRKESKSAPGTLPVYPQERLEEFFRLLEEHVSEHKQVADYAAMLHLSPYQLNAITKATLGKTCSELIGEHLILEAKRHLLATHNQVKEIAYHLGYEDVSYFIRYFRKRTGPSHQAFRQKFK